MAPVVSCTTTGPAFASTGLVSVTLIAVVPSLLVACSGARSLAAGAVTMAPVVSCLTAGSELAAPEVTGADAAAPGAAAIELAASAVLSRVFNAGASTILGFGANGLGMSISTGATSSRVTITRTPILVTFQSNWANLLVSRMQPCEAGWPGRGPSCSAAPDQVMRCMYGIAAP